ncbi:S8 family peptidase [Micromonospora echinofusca]|nr:S8 family peptidase [Micromonospora echinofusca]
MTTPAHRARRVRAALAVCAAAIVAATTTLTGPATAGGTATATGVILGAGGATAVPGSYLVTLADDTVTGPAATRRSRVADAVARLTGRYGVTPDQVWSDALTGFAVRMPEAVARRMAADPAVARVEQDSTTWLATTQLNPPWGLDRIDAASGLNGSYSWVSDGTGVRAYIIDSGIQTGHQDFGGQAVYGYDAFDGMPPANDCSGHGTHAAGTVGGTTYGVAKNVLLVAVKVFDCVQPSSMSILISGINWVIANHPAGQPGVATVGVLGAYNATLNSAVASLVTAGITVAVPAGNSNANACNYSPASAPTLLTVAATASNDSRASFSNYGSCVDIFAAGVSVLSAWYTAPNAAQALSGTSQAAPHVAGAAARVLDVYPTWTPAQVANYLFSVANPAVLNPGAGSPNRLLYLSPSF